MKLSMKLYGMQILYLLTEKLKKCQIMDIRNDYKVTDPASQYTACKLCWPSQVSTRPACTVFLHRSLISVTRSSSWSILPNSSLWIGSCCGMETNMSSTSSSSKPFRSFQLAWHPCTLSSSSLGYVLFSFLIYSMDVGFWWHSISSWSSVRPSECVSAHGNDNPRLLYFV